MKPTDEQVKEFWEWCGFKYDTMLPTRAFFWKDPAGLCAISLPPIDLNNLFKHAVPICINKASMVELSYSAGGYRGGVECIAKIGKGRIKVAYNDPALALFWAIYEVIKGGKQ